MRVKNLGIEIVIHGLQDAARILGRKKAGGCRARRLVSATLELLSELDSIRTRLRRNDVRLLANRNGTLFEARQLGTLVGRIVDDELDIHPVFLDTGR
jgi:hypothetical protein